MAAASAFGLALQSLAVAPFEAAMPVAVPLVVGATVVAMCTIAATAVGLFGAVGPVAVEPGSGWPGIAGPKVVGTIAAVPLFGVLVPVGAAVVEPAAMGPDCLAG